MFRLFTSSLAVFALVMVAGVDVASAAPKKSPEERFTKADKDADGKLTLDEFVGKKSGEKKETAAKRFKKLDKDSDEKLTLDEFKAGSKKAD